MSRLGTWLTKRISFLVGLLEDGFSFLALGAILFLSVGELVARSFLRVALPGAPALIAHATLVFACAGASVASREGRRLGITASLRPRGLLAALTSSLRVSVSSAVLSALTVASVAMVLRTFEPNSRVAFIPTRYLVAALPIAFFAILFRSYGREQRGHPVSFFFGVCCGAFASSGAAVSVLSYTGIAVPPFLSTLSVVWAAKISTLLWPALILLAIAAVSGTPLFLVLAGVAYLSFSFSEGDLEAVPLGAYTMLTGNVIPSIPLFALTGYLLADSGAGKRLFSLFRAAFGWMRGGSAIAVIVVSVFFSTFTGASGITILALGGVLAHSLKETGYTEEQAEGLLASSGALGILLPPSLAVIVYGFVSKVSIMNLFVGGAVPGMIFIVAMILVGVCGSGGSQRTPFSVGEFFGTLRSASGELLLPVIVIAGYFSGYFTLVETGALAALYSIVLVVFIRRDVGPRRLVAAVLKSVPVAGGVLIILAAASGVSDFLVGARVPMFLVELAQKVIPSRWSFLLLLNAGLLVAGCFMDLFSAILIIAPLVIPIAALYGVHPVHLGVVFLTNQSLGFLTPPGGLNLSIASSAFNTSLRRVTTYVLPYFAVQFAVLMLITFFPILTTVFLK